MAAAVGQLQSERETRPINLDTLTELHLAPERDIEAQSLTRSLTRLFTWPLSLLWLAAGAVFGVTIWQGALRISPAQLLADDLLEVSKLAAIDAKARLIRM